MNKELVPKFELVGDKEKTAVKLQKSIQEMECKLNRMSIQRPHHGTRIPDPAHTIYSYSPSIKQDLKR